MDEQPKAVVSLDAEALARLCVTICEGGKAEDLMLFDVHESSILADYYLICTGTSAPHISGLCNRLRQELALQGVLQRRRDGDPSSHWVILDYGTVLVHVMDPERRRFYRIEELWETGRLVYQSPSAKTPAATAP
jgi:ribosome-associated protein